MLAELTHEFPGLGVMLGLLPIWLWLAGRKGGKHATAATLAYALIGLAVIVIHLRMFHAGRL